MAITASPVPSTRRDCSTGSRSRTPLSLGREGCSLLLMMHPFSLEGGGVSWGKSGLKQSRLSAWVGGARPDDLIQEEK